MPQDTLIENEFPQTQSSIMKMKNVPFFPIPSLIFHFPHSEFHLAISQFHFVVALIHSPLLMYPVPPPQTVLPCCLNAGQL